MESGRAHAAAAKRAAAVARYLEGASARAVGAACGVSAPTVLAWVRDAGHQPRKQGGVAARTARQRAEAVARYLDGASARSVGAASGVHRTTVRAWVRQAGHGPRTRPGHGALWAARREEAVARYLDGESSAAVAAAFGVSAATVRRWVRKAGHEPRKRPGQAAAAQRAVAVARYLEGASARSVGAAFGVHRTTVRRWVRQAGHGPRGPERRSATRSGVREEAVARYLEGASARSVGAAFGVSDVTVLRWVRQAGHGPRGPGRRSATRPGVREEAVARYLDAERAAVGAAFGVSHQTVLRWVRQAGHESRPGNGSGPAWAAKRAGAVALYREGASARAVGAAFGVSHETVRRWVRQAGQQTRPGNGSGPAWAAKRGDAVAMYREGGAARAVAAASGVSASSVLAWVRDAGHQPRGRGRRSAARRGVRAAAVAAYLDGEAAPAVGAAFGVTAATVRPGAREEAVARYLDGESSTAVASAYGVHAGTVLAWVRAEGHEPRKRGGVPARTARQRAAAVEAYLEGASAAAVSSAFGVSAASVLVWVRAEGHEPRKPGSARARTARQREEAVARYLDGGSSPAVGAVFGVNHNTVLRWVRQAGHEPRGCGRRSAARRQPPGRKKRTDLTAQQNC